MILLVQKVFKDYYFRIQEYEETVIAEIPIRLGLQSIDEIEFKDDLKVNEEIFNQVFNVDDSLEDVLIYLIENFDNQLNQQVFSDIFTLGWTSTLQCALRL